MKLTSNSLTPDAAIPGAFAFAVPNADSHVTFSSNKNPHLAWSGAPEGTRSFAIICVDSKAPTRPDDVNQEGREVPADLPRADFAHWALVDLPASTTEVAEGAHSAEVTVGGKGAEAPEGRHGVNDYTGWFGGDETMKGTYYGYDGPGPPWNDALVHEYTFTVFALDVARLPVEGAFTVADVVAAAAGHVLASASLVGTYTLNPRLR